MKAKDRKRVQELLGLIPEAYQATMKMPMPKQMRKTLEGLNEEFTRKGFLSRKELKILDRLATIQLATMEQRLTA